MTPGVRGCLVRGCPSTIITGGGLCAFHRDSWERYRQHEEWAQGSDLHPWQVVLKFERWCWRAHRELIREDSSD